MSDAPIFVVGVPRSGTTLLAAMLAAHDRLSCGPETHFFRRLAEVDAAGLCDGRTWPRPAAEFIWAISHTALLPGTKKGLLDKYEIARDSIPAYLGAREPSVAAVLASVTEQYMTAKGKKRWVEKTPDHLLYAQSVRKHFPESPILRIVRDPRDTALSLMKVPWGVKSFLEGLLYWERLDRLSRDVLAADRRCYTLRFEDLVSSPREELRKVCSFIGEDFQEGMLDTSRTGVQINSRNAPWKDKVSQAPDTSRIGVWRAELTREQKRLAEAVLGDRLRAWGYSQDEALDRAAIVHPGLAGAEDQAGALEVLASKGVRFWTADPAETPRATVYLGDPVPAAPGERPAARVRRALSVLADVAGAVVSRRELYWIPDGDSRAWAGYLSFVCRALLSPYRVTSAIGDRRDGWSAAPAGRGTAG